MFAYFAFKALTWHYPDALSSAQHEASWTLDQSIGLPCLLAAKGSFNSMRGICAATLEEAQRLAAAHHDGNVYLVAPLPGKQAVVGEAGWHAEGVLCLGPLTPENQAQVARLIVTAAAKGLP